MVHSMGILLEADYKGIISGREGAFGIMRKMLKTKSDVASPENMSVTYDVINRDSGMSISILLLHKTGKKRMESRQLNIGGFSFLAATSLAAESQIAKIPTFVYISAAASAPFLPWGYLNSKREAEDLISQEYASLRSIFMRPPFIYDPTRPISLPIAAGGYLGHEANLLSKGKLKEWVGAMAQKPMKVDVVGEAVVEAIDDEKVKGVVGPEEMEDMGVKGWRKSMI